MATTKIWAVKDSIARVLKYAANPEGTTAKDLAAVIAYAGNIDKTVFGEGETCHLVTALNCHGDPFEDMMRTHRHFNPRGTNLAYHAYQSFKPGEVTPDICHEIGVKLAEKLWPDHQVLVASHLNREHLHNHFVILATKYTTGRKLDIGGNYWKRMLAPASDEICRAYGLSVQNTNRKAPPRCIYYAEKEGKDTPYRLMYKAVKKALAVSCDKRSMRSYLYEMGYEYDAEQNTIKSRFSKSVVPLTRLGETFDDDLTKEAVQERLYTNRLDCEGGYVSYPLTYEREIRERKKRNGYLRDRPWYEPGSLAVPPYTLGTLGRVLKVFLAILGRCPGQVEYKTKHEPLTPEVKAFLREEERRCRLLSRAAIIMGREHLETGEDTMKYLEKVDDRLTELVKKRQKLYYKIKASEDENELDCYQYELYALNREISGVRDDKKALVDLLDRSGVLEEWVNNELLMRREKRERDYLEGEPEFVSEELPPEKYIAPIADEPKPQPRKRSGRDER